MHGGYSPEPFVPDGADAFGALLALIEVIEAHDDHPDPSGASDLREMLEGPHFDIARDLVVVRSENALVGWAAAVHRPSTERHVASSMRGGVHPEHQMRGLGSALLEWSEARGREQMADAPVHLQRWLVCGSFESQRRKRRLLKRHDFPERRWFVNMKRPLDESPTPTAPSGISIVPWADGYAEQVRGAHAAAFADHWGSTAIDPATWKGLLAADGTRLDLSFVALDGDVVVGYSFNEAWPADDEDEPERVAWIGSLGTLRSHRRRGIAGSLLDYSHQRFARAGFTHAMLDVDIDSPTDAGSIYEAHGYVPVFREVIAVKQYGGAPAS